MFDTSPWLHRGRIRAAAMPEVRGRFIGSGMSALSTDDCKDPTVMLMMMVMVTEVMTMVMVDMSTFIAIITRIMVIISLDFYHNE